MPLIVKWPGVDRARERLRRAGHQRDYLPTYLEIAGAAAPASRAVDGGASSPCSGQSGALNREAMYWHYPALPPRRRHALRRGARGDFKLIEFLRGRPRRALQPRDDLGETRDLAAELPEKTAALRRKLHAWRQNVGAQMPTPTPTPTPRRTSRKTRGEEPGRTRVELPIGRCSHRCPASEAVGSMSMIGEYLRVAPDELTKLQASKTSIVDYLYPEEEDEHPAERRHDVDKAWHAIHYLLNGSAWGGEPPRFNAVLGGEPIGDDDLGYGPVRFLTADEVRDVADALEDVPVFVLMESFDPEAMNGAEIYPESWGADDQAIESIAGHYTALAEFFRTAAQAGDAMLLYLS